MMTAVEYWVEADENGKIEIGLPKNFPKDGKIRVLVMNEVEAERPISVLVDENLAEISDEELAELKKPGEPLTGAEIMQILEQDKTPSAWDNAPDGVTWVAQQREARRKRIWGERG